MRRSMRLWTLGLPLALLAAAAATPVRADAVAAVQVLRAGGCGGLVPIAPPLQHNSRLDEAAQEWAGGTPLPRIADRNGLRLEEAAGVHVTGPDATLLEQLRRHDCHVLTDRSLREIGAYHRGSDTWLVMLAGHAVPAAPPVVPAAHPSPSLPPPLPPALKTAASPAAELSGRALALVNEARARGTRCGARPFAPAPPLSLSGTLGNVAYGHASDMAEHNYFEHEDLAGQTPADRVRSVGYREKLVGENIAYGPQTVDEVVQGWLDSPEHCENIMDPRFVEMGVAFASGRIKHGLYWVQLLAEPRA
jgi:uncharacterized protein YkwD